LRHRGVRYRGYDVSRPAIERAREKYPDGSFSIVDPDLSVLVDAIRKAAVPQVVYSKDVMHHQVKPLDFLSALIRIPTHAVVLRCRTRDTGKTEWDPDQSCQYHYNGWMPYIVINTDELIEFVRSVAPAAEIIVMKNPMVLGGLHNRYLPKECYLTQTGTAETAIAILLHSSPSGRIRMENRPDATPRYTVLDRLLLGIKARLQ
jgi:hypothetical protein